jgi:hypothetical protein
MKLGSYGVVVIQTPIGLTWEDFISLYISSGISTCWNWINDSMMLGLTSLWFCLQVLHGYMKAIDTPGIVSSFKIGRTERAWELFSIYFYQESKAFPDDLQHTSSFVSWPKTRSPGWF